MNQKICARRRKDSPRGVQQKKNLSALQRRRRRLLYHTMQEFTEINVHELTPDPFTLIGSDWLLITAEKDGKVNTMTASWGALGVMWGMPAAFIAIRPQRYTKEFVDAAERLSLCVLGQAFRKELSYLGSVSGRDEPKIQKAELTVRHEDGVPFFAEAQTVLLCRKLFAQELSADSFIDASLLEKWYPAHDLHTLYVCAIERVLSKRA